MRNVMSRWQQEQIESRATQAERLHENGLAMEIINAES
jgi:hypothetical protein